MDFVTHRKDCYGRRTQEEGRACSSLKNVMLWKLLFEFIGDLHVKKATKQRRSDTGHDTECVYVYEIHNAQQAIRIQREDRPKEIIIVHVRELFDITSIFNTLDIFRGHSPVWQSVIIPSSGIRHTWLMMKIISMDSVKCHCYTDISCTLYSTVCRHLGFRTVLHIIRINVQVLHDGK